MATLTWELYFRNFDSLGTEAWDRALGIFRSGSVVWDTSFRELAPGRPEESVEGKPGVPAWAHRVYRVFKKLSENPVGKPS